jgi:pantothenate kinase
VAKERCLITIARKRDREGGGRIYKSILNVIYKNYTRQYIKTILNNNIKNIYIGGSQRQPLVEMASTVCGSHFYWRFSMKTASRNAPI